MPIPQITIKLRKDGREVARFRDEQGLVRTRVGVEQNWSRAEQMKELGEYGIALQLDQAKATLGSNGVPMPPLTTKRYAIFEDGKFRRPAGSYSEWKLRKLGNNLRNLSGPGKDGHMLDDIRMNYLDDKKVAFAITRRSSRIKALANEKHAPWWGWTDASAQKLQNNASLMFQSGVAEHLYSMGLIGANALASAPKRAFFSRNI